MTTLDGTTTATTTPGTANGSSTTTTTSGSAAPEVSNGAHGNGATSTAAGNDTKDMATATSNTTAPEVSNGATMTTRPDRTTTPATANPTGAPRTAPGNDANGTPPPPGSGATTGVTNGSAVAVDDGGDGDGNGGVGRGKGRRTQRERSAASASRLLDAAIELIATQGFAATTQADIGTRAGYSRAMVRERFGSAEALLDALFQRLVDDWHLQAAPLMAGLTGPEVLAVGLELFRDRLRERPLEARCLFVLQFEAAGPTRSLRERVAGVNRALTASVACALRDGQTEGTVRDDVDPDTAAIDWVAQFRGANFLWLVDPTYDLDGFCARWAAQQFVLFGPSVASVR